jgi:hypothetical protein
LRSRTWGILEEVYNIVPKDLIVEISIYGAPGGDVGKRESDLGNSISS